MNIIHRDINPHNVLVSYAGDLKIIDFGIAKSEMTDVHTATGTIKGKFVYMSPEQSAADPIDRKSDIFSLGIVIYEMATGENPFVRQNVGAVAGGHPATRRAHTVEQAPRRGGAGRGAGARAGEEARRSLPDRVRDARRAAQPAARVGSVRPSENDLSGFLSELFRAEIEEEDRLLAEADRATSPPRPIVSMTPSPDPRSARQPAVDAGVHQPASGPQRRESDHDTKADRPSAHAAAHARSRVRRRRAHAGHRPPVRWRRARACRAWCRRPATSASPPARSSR
jgi:serine/threonine protein kinase